MDARPLSPHLPASTPALERRARSYGALGIAGWASVAVGVVMVAVLLLSGAGLPFTDLALDAECDVASGTILARDDTGARSILGRTVRVRFVFRVGEHQREGVCYTIGDAAPAGSMQTVEYLRRDPQSSRLRDHTHAAPGLVPWQVPITALGAGVALLLVHWRVRVGRRQAVAKPDHAARARAGAVPAGAR